MRSSSLSVGYVGDPKATSTILDSEGWLRTGDICYFDGEGFLYVVDRLKELIKYKGYQVLQYTPHYFQFYIYPVFILFLVIF